MIVTRLGYTRDTEGARFCRAVCARLRSGTLRGPAPSPEAQALCQVFCTTFLRRRPMLAVRRTRPTGA